MENVAHSAWASWFEAIAIRPEMVGLRIVEKCNIALYPQDSTFPIFRQSYYEQTCTPGKTRTGPIWVDRDAGSMSQPQNQDG